MSDDFPDDADFAEPLEEGTITRIIGHPFGGLYQIHFENGQMVHLQSGFGAWQLASVYGSLADAIGKRIRYATDSLNVLSYIEPVEYEERLSEGH